MEQISARQHALEDVDESVDLDEELQFTQQVREDGSFVKRQVDNLNAFTIVLNVHPNRVGESVRPEYRDEYQEVWEVRYKCLCRY